MSRSFTCLFCLAVLILVLAVTPAESQELRGAITGVVTDNTGAVLPGVTVTATSPALIQPQVVVSGEQGTYRFPSLPPGVYAVKFELPGFQTLVREELRLALNMTLTVNVTLQLAGVEETLTITGESPVVDVKSTTTGVNFTEELLEDIPNARDIWAAMAQAPGFHMQAYDVGGSHTGTQTGFQTYGYNDQNRTLLEGINVTENTDANAGYFDYGSFEDFQLGGAGNMGETHGMGAFFNLTVKSGGDDFHGDVYFDYESDSTISDNVPDEFKTGGGVKDGYKAPAAGLSRGNAITEQTDLNLGLGGPIWKGKAWFYAGYRRNNQFKVALGLPDPSQTQLINYTIKGTYAINSKNNIIAFFNKRTKLQAARNLSLTCPLECSSYQASNNKPSKVEWTSVLSDRAFLDVQYSNWFNQFPLFPQATHSRSTEGAPVGRLDRSTGQQTGSDSYYQDRITYKPQFSGSFSYYRDDWKGTHNIKLGTEIYRERREFWNGLPGDIYYFDRSAGVVDEVDIHSTPVISVNDLNVLAFYAQDSWTIGNRLTMNLGFRFDRYTIGWPEQSYAPNQKDFFPPTTVGAQTLLTWNNPAPRLGFAYDVTGRGKTVIKGFWGRFSYNPSTELGDDENPVGLAQRRYRWTDLNGNLILDPGPDGSYKSSPELGAFLRSIGGAGSVKVDRDMTNAWGQELSAHVEHEVAEALSIRGSYVWKLSRNNYGNIDVLRANQYTIPFTYNDVGADNIAGTGDDQVVQLLDRPAGIPEDRRTTNPQRYGLPESEQDYHTIEVALNRRFKDKWLFLTSFQHTWAEDFRSTTSSTSALGVARNGTGYDWRPNYRRFGKQPTNWWNFKMTGRYVLPYDIAVAGSYKLQSGYNVVRSISVRLPNAGSETLHAAPVESDRAPNVGILDFRVEKSFTMHPRWGRVTGMLDIFNLLNSDTVANYRITTGTRYNEVIALLDPRIVRFGIRFEF